LIIASYLIGYGFLIPADGIKDNIVFNTFAVMIATILISIYTFGKIMSFVSKELKQPLQTLESLLTKKGIIKKT